MIPYKNYSNEKLKELLIYQEKFTQLPDYMLKLIDMAFDDNWDPKNDFDGCTVVQDFNHPDLACFIHDWLWITGKGGKYSNKLFYKIMRLEGVPKRQARRRYIAVTLAWNLFYQFKKRKTSKYILDDIKCVISKYSKK